MKKTLIFIVFISLSLLLTLSVQAQKASLYLLPEKGNFGKGEIFSVDLKVNTAGLPINAAETILYFSKDELKVVNISKENSIFSLWPAEPIFSNSLGEISFSGGMPHPGFNGEEGQIITIKFEAQKEGIAEISFGESKILADDGKGTDIFSFALGANFEIKPTAPPIFSSTHPDQNQWHSNKNPELHWELGVDINEISFVLDKEPKTFPDEISEGKLNSKIYQELEDEIWYFHLRVKTDEEWSLPSHFKVQIDTNPPLSFDVAVDNGGDSTNPRPLLHFEAEDQLSGIDYYSVKIDEKEFSWESNPYQTPILAPGVHPVTVIAFDRAQNSTESKTQIEVNPIEKPQISVFPEKYIAGEEVLYMAGTSLPEVEITVFMKKNEREIKRWTTLSNSQGEWSFSTKNLFKSGTYQFILKARDRRGAVSEETAPKTVEISLSGLALGPILVTFRMLTLILGLISILGILIFGFLILRIKQSKKILKKETREAKESLDNNFAILRKEIEKRIELLDSQPGFTKKERKVYDDLKKFLKTAEESVSKEVGDIEKELE